MLRATNLPPRLECASLRLTAARSVMWGRLASFSKTTINEGMRRIAESALWPLGLALTTSATALLITPAVAGPGDEPILMPFTVAVVITAWWGGFRAGGVATALSLLFITFFLVEPTYSFANKDVNALARVGAFCVTALVIAWIVGMGGEMRRRLARELEEKTRLANTASELASIVESSQD